MTRLPPDRPRALLDPEKIAERMRLLDKPHIRPLTRYVRELRSRSGLQVPDFDPFDGGVDAELLFLLWKPGKGAKASGFVSRDNKDAEFVFEFMREAKVPRDRAVIWNVIPDFDAKIDSIRELPRLFELLRSLRGVVLVGRKAQRFWRTAEDAKDMLRRRRLHLFGSYMPDPKVKRYPEKWHSIPKVWAEAGQLLSAPLKEPRAT
jgi:hypothetical protein